MNLAWEAGAETIARSNTARFMSLHGLSSFAELLERSVSDVDWFWASVIEFLGIPFSAPFDAVHDESNGLPWTTWFVGGRINLSEVCVDRWASTGRTAIRWEREDGKSGSLTYSELLARVAATAGALRDLGVSKGSAVGVYLPMSPEAVIAMLAISRLGAVFVPIFSGFGADAIATRLEDAEVKILITADGVQRRGRQVSMKKTADEAAAASGTVSAMLVASYTGDARTPMVEGRDVWWEEAETGAAPASADPTGSEDPVLLTYTSGTTGRPKGVVHVHGGLSVKLVQEGAFQLDLQPDDTHMWLTDMGWIMGPWMVVAGLGNGATIATYDGAPDYPDPGRIWSLVENMGITALGVSPTLIRALQPHGGDPIRSHDISSLRAFGSTGEPWNPDPWWWLFRDVGQEQIPIVNLSGGTEIGACLLSVNLLQGIKPTSLGSPALGIATDVFDQEGQPLREEVGELVVRNAWPSMTRGFWKDPQRYLDTYWNRWDGVWVHGDWASVDEDGFWYLHGRSDETLNIAGKRLGPAEVESIIVEHPQVVMAAAIGVPDEVKGEAIVVYAVAASPSDDLADQLADSVATSLGKPFRPKHVVFVDDLPRTRSAKIMRRVIRATALGLDTADISSLENPASLDGIGRLS